MSSDHDSEQVLEGSSSGDNEESNGFIHVDPHIDPEGSAGSGDGGEASVFGDPVDLAHMDYSLNQEPNSLLVDFVDQDNRVVATGIDPVQDDPNGVKLTEDVGKEDMFVDCPDELTVYDGRNSVADYREAIEIPETQQRLDEKDDTLETHFNESDHRMHVHELTGELEQLRAMLEKTVAEKESSALEFEEERRSFAKEVANLHYQLKVLSEQQSLLNVHDGGLVDHSYKSEMGEGEKKSMLSDAPLHEMINECSEYIKYALDERSQTEGTIRELHAILYMKDQETEDLNARVTELSLSRDVVLSYLNSAQENWSKSLEVSSVVQLEKDRHIDATANRVLAFLATAVNREEMLDEPVTGKLSHIEKSTSLLIEKYNWFLSEIDLLGQSLSEVRSDLSVQDFDTIFLTAREELVEFKRNEVELSQKISHLEDENGKMREQLDKDRETAEMATANFGKLRTELEQERTKYSNTKEKLSMAVTKGKALVQQRDSLKQSLADKTSELDRCLIELQEKSGALEAAELSKEELVRSATFAASLQEALSQRDTMLDECKEILSLSGASDELQLMDVTEKLRWLAHERNELMGISLEFRKLTDAISSIDLPETVLSSNWESQFSWIVESFYLAKDEAMKLQDEIARTREAAHNEIDRLTASLLAETQEKNYLQEECEDLTHKFNGIVEKEHQVSLEKDQMVVMLLEASGIAMDSQEEAYQPQSDIGIIIDRCFEKIKEQTRASLQSSRMEAKIFERFQSLLYIRDQESMMYEQILEEEMLDRSEVNNLSNELMMVSQELRALKDEKGSLQNYLDRSEEKAALLREKLSMAVKKGKGLVQERENLKQLLEEKNATIEKLRLELQQQESAFSECRDQTNKLSADVERIPKLEDNLVVMKDQRDHLEQFLVESNGMLQRVIEAIDDIHLPVDFEEPAEKVKWLAGYLTECQDVKTHAEQELGKIKDEASILSRNFAEAQTTMKSLEDALLVGEHKISQLSEEKRELEVAKGYIEEELKTAMEEASSQTSKFAEVCASKKSIEDALSLAENNISVLISEKEDALVSRAATETELQKAEEEVSVSTSKLGEAYKTIQSLEDAMSQLQTHVSLLAEENNKAQLGRTSLENEITKLKEEADFQASKLSDASLTVKSLEDALMMAESTNINLVGEMKIAEQEISTLNSRLRACMQELAGTHGNMENKSLELSSHLNGLQLLLKDETLLSLLRHSFEKKMESLKEMDLLLKDMRDHFVEMDSEMLQNYPLTEEYSLVFPSGLDNVMNIEMVKGEVNAADGDGIMLSIGTTVEEFHLKNKIFADKLEGFSTFMDKLIAALLTKLKAARDEMIVLREHMKSLKQNMRNIETNKQAQENTILMLESNSTILLSACSDATQELEIEVENNLLEPGSIPELEKLNHGLSPGVKAVGRDAVADDQLRLDSSKYVKTAEKLLSASRNVRNLIKHFQDGRNIIANTTVDLESKLKESRINCEKAIEERDTNQNRVFELETNLETLQNLCNEMRLKLEEYQAKEDKFKEREAELASSCTISLMKEEEAEYPLLSASQVKSLFDRINEIEIPFAQFGVGDLEHHDSVHVKKIFHIIDSVDGLQRQMTLLFRDKEQLQSTLANQVLEIEHLKGEAEEYIRAKQDSEKMKNELFELNLGLEKIIEKFGGDESIGGQNSVGVTGLLPVVEKLVVATILESENSKSKAQELGAKLLGTQKAVDELSSKVKLLEDSNQGRTASQEIIQERGVFEASSLPTRSEISESEDVGPLGNTAIPPVPSAAHVRTLRKGSSDHLAINVDSESDRLISNEETDEDKGHVFKSLNTSGLIPRQGRLIADRIDGIWVSGGRALMSRPRARLGLIAYWLLLHIWLLGSIL